MNNKITNTMSLLEIAEQVMKKKRKPQTLDSITVEVFSKAGLDKKDPKLVAQFELDFELSGIFIYCGEDGKNQLWDLKYRQPSALLDKDGGYLEDPYADDEDVINNELKDDIDYDDKSLRIEDEEDDETEEDDIQEELGLVSEDSETEEIDSEQYHSDDDEDEEPVDDDEDLSDEFEEK